MKHKVSELEGDLLDAAVAKAIGYPAGVYFSPSRDWSEGGPIIERERIHLEHGGLDGMVAALPGADVEPERCWFAACGGHDAAHSKPLIAAMRAYVARNLGEEVELP